jgi:integrase
MTHELVPVENVSIGQMANQYAASVAFSDYQERVAGHTLRRQKADLALFSAFLAEVGLSVTGSQLLGTPAAWQEITHGLVETFMRWQLPRGYAIGSINVRLSTVKKYCALASKAGALSSHELALIKLVQGYKASEGKHVDEKREITRVGEKKAEPIVINREDADKLKTQPDTPQGRRDAFLVCLLLDHGLRCEEIARLPVKAIDLKNGVLTFYRKKVHLTQRHELTRDTLLAATRYFDVARPEKYLIMGSRKGGTLQGRMSDRAITARMKKLCESIELVGASAHDGRHAWVTSAVAGGTDIKALQDAGGWSSPAMPLRYAKSQVIANRGVKLA